MLTLMRKIAKAKFCVIALLFDSITEEGKVSKFQNVNYNEATEEKSHNNSTWLYSNTKWSPQTFNKQNNFLWEFRQSYFTVIGSAFLKVNSLIQSNFKLKSRSDQANNSCYVIEPDDTTRLDWLFSKGNVHLLLLWHESAFVAFLQIQLLFPSRAQYYVKHSRQHVFTLRWTAGLLKI